jgi:hypothetical protein
MRGLRSDRVNINDDDNNDDDDNDDDIFMVIRSKAQKVR